MSFKFPKLMYIVFLMSICTCLVTPELSSKASEARDPPETFENQTLDSLNLSSASIKDQVPKNLTFVLKDGVYYEKSEMTPIYYIPCGDLEEPRKNFEKFACIFREESFQGPPMLEIHRRSRYKPRIFEIWYQNYRIQVTGNDNVMHVCINII
jgi:hypothetical protein